MYVDLILEVCGGGRGRQPSALFSPEKIISEKLNYIEILSPITQIKI
jgi:hypothetical protein